MLDKERVYRFGQMDHYMKVGGEITKPMEKADLYMQMETFMMALGKMIKPMVLVFTVI